MGLQHTGGVSALGQKQTLRHVHVMSALQHRLIEKIAISLTALSKKTGVGKKTAAPRNSTSVLRTHAAFSENQVPLRSLRAADFKMFALCQQQNGADEDRSSHPERHDRIEAR